MKYLVHTVANHELPEGVERVIVERDEGPPLLIISGEAARCWRFMRAWEDTQEPACEPTVALPAPLRAVS